MNAILNSKIILRHTAETKNYFIYEPETGQAVGKLYIERKLFAGVTPPQYLELPVPVGADV